MTPTTNVTVNNYFASSGFTPEQEALHREKAVEIAAKITSGNQGKLETAVSKVSHKILDKQNAFIFKIGSLSKKAIKKLLMDILPSATIRVVKIAIGLIAVLV